SRISMSPFLRISRYWPSARTWMSFGWLEPDERLPHTYRVTVLDQPFDNRCGKWGDDEMSGATRLDMPDPRSWGVRGAGRGRGGIPCPGPDRALMRRRPPPPLGDLPVLVGI